MSEEEQGELIKLMNKVTFPISPAVFYAWCLNFVNTCVELALIKNEKDGKYILLIYRKDQFYNGWHIPGTIVLPGNRVKDALNRIIDKEIGNKVSSPEFLFWYEYMKGNNYGESPRGQVLSLFFMANMQENIEETENIRFFRIDKLPNDIILAHIPVLEKLRKLVFKNK